MLAHGRQQLVDRKSRERFDAPHIPQVLLKGMRIDLTLEEPLSKLEHVLVEILAPPYTRLIDLGYWHGQSKLDRVRIEPIGSVGSISDLKRELFECGHAMIEHLVG